MFFGLLIAKFFVLMLVISCFVYFWLIVKVDLLKEGFERFLNDLFI